MHTLWLAIPAMNSPSWLPELLSLQLFAVPPPPPHLFHQVSPMHALLTGQRLEGTSLQISGHLSAVSSILAFTRQTQVLQIGFLELCSLSSTQWDRGFCLGSLCLEGSLQAAMWAMVRLILFVSLPTRIAALLCLLSSIWKELFYVFAWVSSCSWWESDSQSS